MDPRGRPNPGGWGRPSAWRGALPRHLALASALLLGVGLGWVGCGSDTSRPPDESERLSVSQVLGGPPDDGFLRATVQRGFSFPQDHGPHPGFRNEWWYFTGNLETVDGDPMGYQLTLFRAELAPPPAEGEAGRDSPPSRSGWRTRVAWMGHLAVTDGAGGIHEATERFARESLGLAGAQTEPLRIWLEDWEILEAPGGFLLSARDGGLSVDLEMVAESPPVLQGDSGLSQKGPEPGNASYYYSIPRLSTRGKVAVAGREFQVRGESWLDREWSTSALSDGVLGWDWFSLRLSDGWSLMVYDLRRGDGSITLESHAVLIDPEGIPRPMGRQGLKISVRDTWTSNVDATEYPSRWSFSIPGEDLEFEITPLVPDQEMNLAFRYWEGAVVGVGVRRGQPISMEGFVELTGYDRPSAPDL